LRLRCILITSTRKEPIESSETSASNTQTPGIYPKESTLHINYLLNKLSVICFIVRRLVHILNTETLKVVFANFHYLIKFGIIIWGNPTTIHKVFVVQKHILRTNLGKGPRCSCKGWFVKIYTLPVPIFYIFLLIIFVINNLDNFKTS
jgi:hypothetical protein